MSQEKTNAILKEKKELEAAPGVYSKQKACIHDWDHGLDVKRCSTCPTICVALVGAIHATPNDEVVREHRTKALIFKRRVEYAVHWLRALLGNASRFKTQWGLEILRTEGDPAFQSDWELLVLFFSVLVFSDLVSASHCQISFVSDSKDPLGAARLRSPAALMGALAAETALALESLGMELVEV